MALECSHQGNFCYFLSGSAVFELYRDSKVDLLATKLLFNAVNLGGLGLGLGLGVWKVIVLFFPMFFSFLIFY